MRTGLVQAYKARPVQLQGSIPSNPRQHPKPDVAKAAQERSRPVSVQATRMGAYMPTIMRP